ncbi:glycosyl transferase family 1 [Christiangramia fulva]|uniref:Glycosyl transferase family 1 n=2 Tax=Christiangramia fulva TaxID=2126553 RepID=A0A2R3ZAF4_9FLAO|nr:glycosyl transferase family 1 [Christiangramia fulva]
MVSIFAPHFFNWTEQLRESGHDVYWLDVFDSNTKVEKIDFAQQITGWRYKWDFPGRYFLKKNHPGFNRLINKVNERSFQKVLERKIKEIRPDVIHSFVIYLSAAPVLPVIEKFPKIKWILSTWGSDLFYYSKKKNYRVDIQRVLPRVNYLFTDCKRDQQIAIENGFKGTYLGTFPGGGGFDLQLLESYHKEPNERNLILVKGYQGLHGRAIEVLKALLPVKEKLREFEIVVFGADEEVFHFVRNSEINSWINFKVLGKVSHREVMKLMGLTKIFIGNSLSDGMPNTLLEAIVMEVFPIQSNPGRATEEIITDGLNGLLINNPEEPKHIRNVLEKVLEDEIDIKKAIKFNNENLRPGLDRERIKYEVLKKYKLVEEELETSGS